MTINATRLLDTGSENELILDILSYSGGINEISEDHVMLVNEGRVVKNWDAISLGGMQRAKGFSRVASEAPLTDSDLGHFHFNDTTGGSEILGIFNGGLYKENSGALALISSVFTANELHHAAEGGDAAWITSLTDNLYRYTIAGGVAAPADQPTYGNPRIYRHKNRLVAEGASDLVEGSRVGVGNWTAADAWTLANDAWSINLPNPTAGCVPGFPSGNEILVFTKFEAYAIYNFPSVAFRPISGSRGCGAPYSPALGDEGVYFLSTHPTKGIYLYNGTNFTHLTAAQDWINDVNLSGRIFGAYRNNRYYFIYNETGSGVSYPNRMKIFDAKFSRWMDREVNPTVSDTFGIPFLLTKQNNELYAWSSQKMRLYELETTDTSDEGEETQADYRTKTFTSKDFVDVASRAFPIDNVIMKLLKITISYYGTSGVFTLHWIADDGKVAGDKTFSLEASGALINSTFTVNTSMIVSSADLADRNVTATFGNNAVGRRFQFQILQNGASTLPKIKKIKIYAESIGDR